MLFCVCTDDLFLCLVRAAPSREDYLRPAEGKRPEGRASKNVKLIFPVRFEMSRKSGPESLIEFPRLLSSTGGLKGEAIGSLKPSGHRNEASDRDQLLAVCVGVL